MRVELPGDVASLINLKVVRREQRSQNLADLAFAGAAPAAQHDRRPEPLARLLNDVRHPTKHVPKKIFVAGAYVGKEVIAKHAIATGRRGDHVKAAPEIEIVRSAR